MGQAANIFDAATLRRPILPVSLLRVYPGTPATARLIPGAGNLISTATKKDSQSVMRDGSWGATSHLMSPVVARAAVGLLPQFFRQFNPARLGAAMVDVSVISLVFSLESAILVSPLRSQAAHHPATLGFSIAVFLLLATQEGLYSKHHVGLSRQCALTAKAMLWTILLTSAALKGSSSMSDLLPLMLQGGMSAFALCATRWILHTAFGGSAVGDRRNVLVIGTGAVVQKVVAAIHSDALSRFSVRGLLPEHKFRGIHGPAKLRTMAREKC